jgi:hypothetical protein
MAKERMSGTRETASVRSWISCVVLLISAPLGGCGAAPPQGPPTVPVHGKIIFTKGGEIKTLFDRQAIIAFDSVDQPGTRALGEIQEDGSFTVATIKDGRSKPGAVPGSHRVRLDVDDSATRFIAPQFLDFQKSGITISVPSEQPLEIKVWR